jgi:excinuclease UvrABC ATPase subunit
MFSVGKCGHCGATGTKIVEIEPQDAAYKQIGICCVSCNSILGITDYFDTGTLLKKAELQANAMAMKVVALERKLDQVLHVLQRR